MSKTPIPRLFLLAVALAAASPVLADVKAGVDAWARGDYEAAIREWRGLASTGDPDAQFNMAQAYRLGRGVEQDLGGRVSLDFAPTGVSCVIEFPMKDDASSP